VTAPRQVARRGGILDVFPIDREQPVRIELFGDIVESLRSFDPETQRTSGAAEGLEVVPLSDVFATRSSLQELLRRLPERFPGAREVEGLVERLARGLLPDELGELLALVPGARVPVWDHLEDALPVVIEPEAVQTEAEAYRLRAREDRERRE